MATEPPVHGPTAGTDREYFEGELFVERLTADVIEVVRERVGRSSSFDELVVRECEIDSLWSLADIAVANAQRSTAPHSPRTTDAERLRALLGEAHDLVAIGRTDDAVRLLGEAARCAPT